MRLPVYWCDISNFGDALNPLIFEKLAGIKITCSSYKDSYIVGIGSLLDSFLLSKHDRKFICNPIMVFSSGFGFQEGKVHNPDIILPEKLKRAMKCYALRGNLTKSRIEKFQKVPKDCVIADGGLLASYLIDKSNIKPKYDLGIVPHFADKEDKIFEKIQKEIPNSIILNPTEPVIDFLKHLCECKCVISTAMHPLIACDSLHIPNMWVRVSEKTTILYKFHDYYSAFGVQCEPFYLNKQEFSRNTLIDIQNNTLISYEKIEQKKQELLKALNRIKTDIKRHRIKIYFEILTRKIKKLCINVLCVFIPIKRVRDQIRSNFLNK